MAGGFEQKITKETRGLGMVLPRADQLMTGKSSAFYFCAKKSGQFPVASRTAGSLGFGGAGTKSKSRRDGAIHFADICGCRVYRE